MASKSRSRVPTGWRSRLWPVRWKRTLWAAHRLLTEPTEDLICAQRSCTEPATSGRVFDREVTLDQTPQGYKDMDTRQALKVLVRPG
jgi:hypothetical protein